MALIADAIKLEAQIMERLFQISQKVVKKTPEVSNESCDTCQNTVVASSNMTTTTTTTNTSGAVDLGGDTTTRVENGFTYDDGKGKKDVVQLTGPLSEAYTRALNLYYAKKPILDADSVPDDISEADQFNILSATMIKPRHRHVSQETVQLDDTQLAVIISQIEENKLTEKAKDKFDFVSEYIDSEINSDDVTTIVHMTNGKDALAPEVIDTVQASAEQKNKNVVMVICTGQKFFTYGMDTKRKWLDIGDKSDYNPVFGKNVLDASLESVYSGSGVTVLKDFSEFIAYLNNKA